MNNWKNILTPVVAGVALIIGVIMGLNLSTKNPVSGRFNNAQSEKLLDVFTILENKYVDSVDKEDLLETTISEMLHRLDPHSNYIPARDLKRMSESIQGQFGGVGVRFAIIRDTLNITNVIEGSPADQSGVKKFDQIVKVDTVPIAGVGLTNVRVQELLKGNAGTPVNVSILRNQEKVDLTIVRGMVPINSLVAAFMLNKTTGYMRLSSFSMTSDKEFLNAALDLKAKGMDKLIFDLRYNGGGVMGAAINICDALLPKGDKIVSTKGKNTGETIEFSTRSPLFENLDLVVLINQSSASASEIVAGAIQDNDRGTIIGRRSFGKGLVQQDIELKDGSNLRLTTSRYYTPTGRSIQKPYSGDYEDYLMDEINRYEHGELYEVDSSIFIDSLRFTTPGGKTVYGGGGIMPDVFVPLDTVGFTGYFRRLQYANAFADFAFDFAKNNNLIKDYKTPKNFYEQFNISDKMLTSLMSYASENYTINPNEKALFNSKQLIVNNLKAELARQIWLENGSLYVASQTDPMIDQALSILKDKVN